MIENATLGKLREKSDIKPFAWLHKSGKHIIIVAGIISFESVDFICDMSWCMDSKIRIVGSDRDC